MRARRYAGTRVIYTRGQAPDDDIVACMAIRAANVGRHERAHTYPYQLLGPFFLPVYLLSDGIRGANPFERAAKKYAAGRWWWPMRGV